MKREKNEHSSWIEKKEEKKFEFKLKTVFDLRNNVAKVV